MSLTKLKATAKQLFARVHNFSGIVTTNIIKQQYPRFRASVAEHWELLVLKLLGYDADANKITPYRQLSKTASQLHKHGVYTGRYDHFMGVSTTLTHKSIQLGTVGYSNTHGSWYYSVGRNGRNVYVATPQLAINALIKNIRLEQAA